MTIAVSTNYRRLETAEVPGVAAALDRAWQNPEIPLIQWRTCARQEIENYRNGQRYAHFDGLIRALKRTELENPALLDVGAASGFYSEIFKIAGYDCRYTALDYSEAYEKLARELYPDIDFKVGDARELPFSDSSFDIVVSGCVMLHVADYEKVIAETARVSRQFAVFNRTPIAHRTTFYRKEAYGVPCLEVWFAEDELLDLFKRYGLDLVASEEIFKTAEGGHRTYLTRKA